MSLPLILYYGNTGLESQVFQSYMASSGFKVQVVTSSEAASRALDANPEAIAVVALDEDDNKLVEEAEELQARGNRRKTRVFVLSTQEARINTPEGVDVIPRPYRLSELVRQIQGLTRVRGR
jgi:DNA-binding response OmpR family regulator